MIYGIILRVILAYKLVPVETERAPTSCKTFGANIEGSVNVPKQFGIRFVPRNDSLLREQIAAEAALYNVV
jgi:hypothetical protein